MSGVCAMAAMLALASMTSAAPTARPKSGAPASVAKVSAPKAALRMARAIDKTAAYKGTAVSREVKCLRFESSRWSVLVSAESPRIIDAEYLIPAKDRRTVSHQEAVGIERAQMMLTKWLSPRGVDVNDWVLCESREGGDAETVRYSFSWRRRSDQGVYLPSSLNAICSGDGTPISVDLREDPVSVSLSPAFSRPGAVGAAIEVARLRRPRVVAVELQVSYYPNTESGHQVLRYQVDLQGENKDRAGLAERCRVYIDARNGDVMQIDSNSDARSASADHPRIP